MKKTDYAKLLAAYPLSQKIFSDAEDAPLDELEPPEITPDGDGTEEDEDKPLYDPEQIKEDVRRNLALWTEEDLKVEEDEYRLLIDSLGDPEDAAVELKIGDAMSPDDPEYVEWVIAQGNGLVKDLATEAELPGIFEFELDEEGEKEEEAGDNPENPDAMKPSDDDYAVNFGEAKSAAEAEPATEPEAAEPEIPSIDLVYKFSKADLDQLLSEGYALMKEGEEEPSFDDIMSSLVQAGLEPMARRIYNIIYPQRNH